jgi:uncharacterized protein (DUF433 family)
MVAAPINHIVLDERGVAYIAGTRIKVRHVVIQHSAWNQSPQQIREAYPQLSLGQIYAALAYYCDHQEPIDAEIAAADRLVEELRAQHPNPLTRAQLEERLRQAKQD